MKILKAGPLPLHVNEINVETSLQFLTELNRNTNTADIL